MEMLESIEFEKIFSMFNAKKNDNLKGTLVFGMSKNCLCSLQFRMYQECKECFGTPFLNNEIPLPAPFAQESKNHASNSSLIFLGL